MKSDNKREDMTLIICIGPTAKERCDSYMHSLAKNLIGDTYAMTLEEFQQIFENNTHSGSWECFNN